MPRSSPSPESVASTTGMSGGTQPEGPVAHQTIQHAPQTGRCRSVLPARDSARTPRSLPLIHCSDGQRTLLPALLQPVNRSPGRPRSYFEERQGKQPILCPAETEHPFHPRHHALESTGLASNTETDSPRPRDAACLSMSQVLSRVCRKLCRKFVASSLLQAKPIEQVIGCPLCNEQTAVCHPPQIPLQRTSADPRKKCLELADLDGGKL